MTERLNRWLLYTYGIPDLGFVIHYQRPASLVHYYQQVGRAGRALKRSCGVLLAGGEEERIAEQFFRSAFPPQAHVGQVLRALERAEDGLYRSELEKEVALPTERLDRVLKFLGAEYPPPQ